jgi:TIR domain
MPKAGAPRVFISYSHDSSAHRDSVLDLADRLRADGIDASIDQYEQSPPRGWPNWCAGEISKADFVLMVCTETYLRRVNGEEEPGKGHGVLWEAKLINQHLYDSGSVSSKFVPVLLSGGSDENVPTPVRGASIYRVETQRGYDALYRLLTKPTVDTFTATGSAQAAVPAAAKERWYTRSDNRWRTTL